MLTDYIVFLKAKNNIKFTQLKEQFNNLILFLKSDK